MTALPEKDMSQAPARLDAREAIAWAQGYNAALAEVASALPERRAVAEAKAFWDTVIGLEAS